LTKYRKCRYVHYDAFFGRCPVFFGALNGMLGGCIGRAPFGVDLFWLLVGHGAKRNETSLGSVVARLLTAVRASGERLRKRFNVTAVGEITGSSAPAKSITLD
jgi:hypothetical protein